jgi:hypothetical protein
MYKVRGYLIIGNSRKYGELGTAEDWEDAARQIEEVIKAISPEQEVRYLFTLDEIKGV